MYPPNSQPALTVTDKPVGWKDVARSWQKNGKNIGSFKRERKGSDPSKSRITVADVAVAGAIAIRTIFTAPNAIIMSALVPGTARKTTIRPIPVPSAKGSRRIKFTFSGVEAHVAQGAKTPEYRDIPSFHNEAGRDASSQ